MKAWVYYFVSMCHMYHSLSRVGVKIFFCSTKKIAMACGSAYCHVETSVPRALRSLLVVLFRIVSALRLWHVFPSRKLLEIRSNIKLFCVYIYVSTTARNKITLYYSTGFDHLCILGLAYGFMVICVYWQLLISFMWMVTKQWLTLSFA